LRELPNNFLGFFSLIASNLQWTKGVVGVIVVPNITVHIITDTRTYCLSRLTIAYEIVYRNHLTKGAPHVAAESCRIVLSDCAKFWMGAIAITYKRMFIKEQERIKPSPFREY
jgi:hypothetical protein